MSKKVKLENVRLSFPAVFQQEVFQGEKGKYAATLLFPKTDKKLKAKLDKVIEETIAQSGFKVAADKICLKDGDDSEFDGYEGNWALRTKATKRPTVINKDKTPLTEDDEVIYAGCRVNAIVDFWVQNNQYGKRVNANLYGIQFAGDDEPFGIGPVDVTDDFDEIVEDDDEEI
jgi:hypothetical protein